MSRPGIRGLAAPNWATSSRVVHLPLTRLLVRRPGGARRGCCAAGCSWASASASTAISTLTYFFLTWFPVYLVQQRGLSILNAGLVASVPALCGFAGGILGGLFSDGLLRRGASLTAARKVPIVVGMLLSMTMIGCNYVAAPWAVVALMALAFLGKGIGALGWAVVSDIAPPGLVGLSGGIFNMFGNVAGITTPIVIGLLVERSGSFDGALVFVGANAAVAIVSYLLVVGNIKRLQFDH